MASVALDPAYRRVSVEEFLAMDFGGARAELEDGLIYMMAGGTEEHARLATNIIVALRLRTRGSGCRPYGSDLAARTGDRTIRFPDVSLYCGRNDITSDAGRQLIGDPVAVFEVLSPSTASHDQKAKLQEYTGMTGVRDIVFVDPATQRIRHVRRHDHEWIDGWLPFGADLALAGVPVTLPHAEIFADD